MPRAAAAKLLSLPEGVAGFTVETAKVFGLDEVETIAHEVVEQVDHFSVRHVARSAVRVHAQEAAAPVVRAKGFGETAGPYFDAAVRDHLQLETRWTRLRSRRNG